VLAPRRMPPHEARPAGNVRYTLTVLHENSLIAAFVKRNKRERYREIVSDSRLRHKFTGQLAHFKDFDPQYRLPIPSNKLFVENIAKELDRRHSPKIVFAISEDPALDQKQVPLVRTLEQIVGRGMGTILSCIPGRLAFVETEDERFILQRQDRLERREYLRFVVGHKDEDSHVEQGIFQAVARAVEWETITGADADELNTLRTWFNENLEKPTAFGRGKFGLGISWFKLDATEHITRIWQMIRILERHGIHIKKIKTDKPGYVVYEDEWQVVAEPFRRGTLPRK
jgi:hypothetical protein